MTPFFAVFIAAFVAADILISIVVLVFVLKRRKTVLSKVASVLPIPLATASLSALSAFAKAQHPRIGNFVRAN